MPPATLYHVPKTISSPIVQTLLELDDGPSVHIETLTFKQLKSTEYLKINPMGTSPALTDGSHVLQGPITMFESGAILSWILEEYDTKHKLHPAPSSPGRARFLFLQQYIIATVYPYVASLYIHSLKPAEEQDTAYLESGKEKWKTLLGPTLQSYLLHSSSNNGSGPYFMGGASPSAIDFLAAKPLGNARSMGLLADDFPALQQLLERIERRPSYAGAYGIVPPPQERKPSPVQTRQLLLVPSSASSNAEE